jgi:hypothetical protein
MCVCVCVCDTVRPMIDIMRRRATQANRQIHRQTVYQNKHAPRATHSDHARKLVLGWEAADAFNKILVGRKVARNKLAKHRYDLHGVQFVGPAEDWVTACA